MNRFSNVSSHFVDISLLIQPIADDCPLPSDLGSLAVHLPRGHHRARRVLGFTIVPLSHIRDTVQWLVLCVGRRDVWLVNGLGVRWEWEDYGWGIRHGGRRALYWK